MKKGIGVSLFLGLALLLPLRRASAQAVQSVEWRLQITAAAALVRATPDGSGAVLLTLAKGTMLPSFEKTGEWFRVVVETGEGGLTVVGYVAAPDVEVIKAIVRSVGDFWTEETGEFHGLGLSVKVSGGAGFLTGGDVSRASQGMFLAAADAILSQGYETYERVEKFRFKGPEIALDLQYRLTPWLSLGAGAGVLETAGRGFLGYYEFNSDTSRLETKPVLQITPYRLSATVTLPIHRLFNVYAQAGPAYYRAKISHQLMIAAGGYYRTVGQLAVSRALGFQAGCGLELVLTSRGCWFLEVQGRFARFKDFNGEKRSVQTEPFLLPKNERSVGGLYYLDEEPYPRLDILAGSHVESSGIHSFTYDLRSVSLWTGIRVKF